MAQDTISRVSFLRRHLSPPIQLILVVAVVAVVVAGGTGIFALRETEKNAVAQAERTRSARSDAAPGTFRPTKEQWAGFKIEPVQLVSFRPEQVTEGSIAIDDDLTTPVF